MSYLKAVCAVRYGRTCKPIQLASDAPGQQPRRLCSILVLTLHPRDIHDALPLPLERVRDVGLELVDDPVDLADGEHLHRLRHREGREPVVDHAVRAAVQRGRLHGPVGPAVDGGLQRARGLVEGEDDVVGPPVGAEGERGDLRGRVDGQV